MRQIENVDLMVAEMLINVRWLEDSLLEARKVAEEYRDLYDERCIADCGCIHCCGLAKERPYTLPWEVKDEYL